jgi:hypothetical protein
MEDQEVINRINQLAHEEESLYQEASHGALSPKGHERLKQLEVQLDQCYDLLHQRRARRNAGLDPNEAQVRDAGTVEGYVD